MGKVYYNVKTLINLFTVQVPNKLNPLSKIARELKRIAYSCFDVSCLDGLDTFEKFSENYVVVNVKSPLMKEIRTKNENILKQERNAYIRKLVK